MRKYLHIFKATLIEKMQSCSNLFLSFALFGLIVFILLNVWKYIYSDINTIHGYTLNQIMWYVLLAEALWFGGSSRSFSEEISYDIKSGNIAYKINKPYSYVFFAFSKFLGHIIFRLVIFFAIGITFGIIFIGPLQNFDLKNIFLLGIVYTLGVAISSFIYIIVGLSAFWLEENRPIHWIYDKIMIVLGVIFPLEMLPFWLQPLSKFTPVFVCTYGPIKLTVDFSINIFYQIITTQILWFIGTTLLALFIYQKGVKKINANGG